MMHLAYKAGQVLYFRGKKWRLKVADTNSTSTTTPKAAKVTVQPIPADESTTATYKLNGRNRVYANVLAETRAPLPSGAYVS